jgi:hypothetical protein
MPRQTIPLTTFTVCYAEPGTSIDKVRGRPASDWLPATVPGGEFASVGESRLYRRYAAYRGKFISEFGIHASPELATLRRWLPEDQLQVHSPGFDHHNKDNPRNKHDPVLEIITGLPMNIAQYVDFTMISQAEGLKFGIEHYRRRQPHCNGTLIWRFNDVWPGFSWSVIDYAGIPKAGYHFARRAFAPVIASFCQGADGELQLWMCNSSALPIACDAEVTLGRFSAVADVAADISTEVEPGQARLVWSIPRAAYDTTPDRYAWVISPSGVFAPNPILLRRDQRRELRFRQCRVRGRPQRRRHSRRPDPGHRVQLLRPNSDTVAAGANLGQLSRSSRRRCG